MTLAQHLDNIYQLVLDRADPAKVRGHIELIRDQVETASHVEAQLRKQIARDKKSHAKEIAELRQAHAKEMAHLKKTHKQAMTKIAADYAAYKELVENYGVTPNQLLKEVKAEQRRRGLKADAAK